MYGPCGVMCSLPLRRCPPQHLLGRGDMAAAGKHPPSPPRPLAHIHTSTGDNRIPYLAVALEQPSAGYSATFHFQSYYRQAVAVWAASGTGAQCVWWPFHPTHCSCHLCRSLSCCQCVLAARPWCAGTSASFLARVVGRRVWSVPVLLGSLGPQVVAAARQGAPGPPTAVSIGELAHFRVILRGEDRGAGGGGEAGDVGLLGGCAWLPWICGAHAPYSQALCPPVAQR
jgi:hypothetical protein